MKVKDKLKKIMKENKAITQTKLAALTGLSPTTIHYYVKGYSEPNYETRVRIAEALGMDVDYWLDDPEEDKRAAAERRKKHKYKMSVDEVATLMGMGKRYVHTGLQQGILPFGWGVKMDRWEYFISRAKFEEATGIIGTLDLQEAEEEKEEKGA